MSDYYLLTDEEHARLKEIAAKYNMGEPLNEAEIEEESILRSKWSASIDKVISNFEEELALEIGSLIEGDEESDPTIKFNTTPSGTVTRYRIVDGKKQIIDELRPLRSRRVGGLIFIEGIDETVGSLALDPELQAKILAKDSEALALAEKFGVEAHVKWYRRFQPNRKKQVDSPGALEVPQGAAARAVSEAAATTGAAMAHKAVVGTVSRIATNFNPGQSQAIQKAIEIRESGKPVTPQQIQELDDLEAAFDLPKDTF